MKELVGPDDLQAWLASGESGPVTVQAVALDSFAGQLGHRRLAGSVLLGCSMDPALRDRLSSDQVTVVDDLGLLPEPLRCFPTRLYTARTLYAGFDPDTPDSWRGSPDHKGWAFFMKNNVEPQALDLAQAIAARLHDTSIERALDRLRIAHGAPSIAIMGGHDVLRSAPAYRQVVRIARALRRCGYLIVTGGGPGLMEAGNLGAFLAPHPDDALDQALNDLSDQPFQSHAWLATAARVRARFNRTWHDEIPADATSLAIPTWLYGHEPPNLFSSHIAKMFYNSLREDGLVTVANGGILFGRGNAGTVQEIFQDLTQNYYRGKLSATPMVFLESAYWNRACDSQIAQPPTQDPTKSVLPLVRQLAAEKDFLASILVSDDVAEIVAFLGRDRPPSQPGRRAGDVRLQAHVSSTR